MSPCRRGLREGNLLRYSPTIPAPAAAERNISSAAEENRYIMKGLSGNHLSIQYIDMVCANQAVYCGKRIFPGSPSFCGMGNSPDRVCSGCFNGLCSSFCGMRNCVEKQCKKYRNLQKI